MTSSARSGRPRQRAVAAEILLAARWVAGTLPVPETQESDGLPEHIRHLREAHRCVGAGVRGRGRILGIAAVGDQPDRAEYRRSASGNRGRCRHHVAVADRVPVRSRGCSTDDSISSSTFDCRTISGNRRDFWSSATAFGPPRPVPAENRSRPRRSGRWCMVNPARTLGIVERDNPPSVGHLGRLVVTEWDG